MSTIDALDEGDAFEIVAPLVIDADTDHVTHLDFVIGETHYYIGWNPENERWERILVVVDEGENEEGEGDETIVVETAVSVFDDETGEPVLVFDQTTNPSIEDIVEFVWGYIEYTYPETTRLFNVMDEALAEVSSNGD